MSNYSDNWRHLKTMLVVPAPGGRNSVHSYADHTQSKALAIFLANAELATPKLNRATVTAILEGQQVWPHTSGVPFAGTALTLSFLEEHGFIAFYAGWCTAYCAAIEDHDSVDPSLIPLLQAVGYLEDICHGWNGCVQPHYFCPEEKLHRQLENEFGHSLKLTEILPELSLEKGFFKLMPGNQNFSTLVSTYLWMALRTKLNPREAFDEWIMCLRVNCTWAMPILADYLEYSERDEFNDELVRFVAEDNALSFDLATLRRQAINEYELLSILRPTHIVHKMEIDAEGNRRSDHQTTELPKPTLASLSAAYPHFDSEVLSDLEFVQDRWGFGVRRSSELFYTAMLSAVIESTVRIEGQALVSSGVAETLLQQAITRPILKHMLYHLVPLYEHGSYMILLLSRPATCDVALYYLTKGSPSLSRRDRPSFAKHIDDGYQRMVCFEYLRTLAKESDFSGRLLKAIALLGGRCALQAADFSKSFEYDFLLTLLDSLNHQQLIQLGMAFALLPGEIEKPGYSQYKHHYRYLLGFWILERLESTGIDPTDTVSLSLRSALLKDYQAEFAANLAGLRSLEPNAFFSTVPWHRLAVDDGGRALLSLSNDCNRWPQRLAYVNKHHFEFSSAVRHYLQVLIGIGRSSNKAVNAESIARRAAEIVRSLGFGPRVEGIYLFDAAFYSRDYELWAPFCSYSNTFRDDVYEEFVDRCVPSIPLDQLFVLLERCSVIARGQQLQKAIETRQSLESEDLGLSGFEQAFTSAYETGYTDLAARLLGGAKALLADRFADSKNPHIVRARKIWLSYEYKWQLLELQQAYGSDPDGFAKAAHQVPIPHQMRDTGLHDERAHYFECERFRRQITASVFCEIDPEKTVRIMQQLDKETKNDSHSFLLFYGQLNLFKKEKNLPRLRSALAYFLASIQELDIGHLRDTWVAMVLDAYRLLGTTEIDSFWIRLTPEQQTRLEILKPYCRALIARGEPSGARRVIGRYRDLNVQTPDELGLEELLEEVNKAEPDGISMSQLVHMINEGSQRSIVQLKKHYTQIVSMDFESYVGIVSADYPHVYLKNVVLEVAQEMVLRKANLQVYVHAKHGRKNSRTTKEDLMNDWFTSLFDKRMAEARVGMRDQKRGGQSASKKNPGEIDGFITDAKNRRIAIFEAFRLFSLDTTVIFDHLDKIAGYDNESLSPVFIAAYCDVGDFSTLVDGYAKLIQARDYLGFTVDEDNTHLVESLHDTDHLWLGVERRRRGRQDVIFYHVLLNLHCPYTSANRDALEWHGDSTDG